jgi:hypothetical protein
MKTEILYTILYTSIAASLLVTFEAANRAPPRKK